MGVVVALQFWCRRRRKFQRQRTIFLATTAATTEGQNQTSQSE